MFTPRRQAQLGLIAASLVFVFSVATIVTGFISQPLSHSAARAMSSVVAPGATGALATLGK